MIQFNLLPDVKLQYIKVSRTRHLATLIAAAAGVAGLALTILLFSYVTFGQKRQITKLNKEIESSSQKLQNTPDLNKILTVQNQLQSLTTLHNDKPVVSRLLPILDTVNTNTKAKLTQINCDFATQIITLDGEVQSLKAVNEFIDTLKFTKFIVVTKDDGGQEILAEPVVAFSKVTLTSYALSDAKATFSISLTFDPLLFKSEGDMRLQIPSITTGSSTNLPGIGN